MLMRIERMFALFTKKLIPNSKKSHWSLSVHVHNHKKLEECINENKITYNGNYKRCKNMVKCMYIFLIITKFI